MSEEMPHFSSQPIGEEKQKKRVVRRRADSRPHTRRSTSPKLDKEMDSQLSSIYRDEHGHLPDMGKIKIQSKHSIVKTFFGILVVGGLLAIAAWAGFFLLPAANKMSDSQIKLSIAGPQEVALGSSNSYKITFENLQNVKLNNATLTVYYPEGFAFSESSFPSKNSGHTEWDLGIVGAKKKGELIITGKNYGNLNKETSWRVMLNYQPENFKSALQKIATFTTNITKSPLNLAITGPEKAVVGSEVEYIFKVQIADGFTAPLLELNPVWPTNFHPASSTPVLKKNSWTITSTTQEMVFKTKGQFSDSTDPTGEVKAVLFLSPSDTEQKFEIANTSLKTALIKNALNLSLAINGSLNNLSIQPGNTLNFTINTKNASSETANKATVKLTIDAPSVEKQSILNWTDFKDVHDGTVKGEQINNDLRRGTIVWNGKNIPALDVLKSNDEFGIDLSIPVKGAEKFDLSSAKEFKINVSAEMSFLDITGKTQTITSNPITITLNSDFSFNSTESITTNNDKDTHEIIWKLTNNFHPLKNLLITADAYGDISWQEPTNIPAGEVKFDPATKKITWAITSMPETLDVLALPLKITLNKKDPTQNTLISKVKITAEDTVTGETITLSGDEISLNTKTTP